jgi:uncharacterized protein YyaL (SSP411 family)
MLYDQALLAEAYVDAYRATGDARWADTARGVFEYVARDLASPDGPFLSAEDADSEGEEGRFYVWTPAQLREVLGDDDAALFARHHGVTDKGNFEHGATVLHLAQHASEPATVVQLAAARAKLLAARGKRVRPHLDDKVVTAWNGLMIASLANGARAFRRRSWPSVRPVRPTSCGATCARPMARCSGAGATARPRSPGSSTTTPTSRTAAWSCSSPPRSPCGSSARRR